MTPVVTIRRTLQEVVNTADYYNESIKVIGTQSKEVKMEVLKEPIEINKSTVDALERMKGTLGFSKKFAWFIVFQDYKIKEEYTYKKHWGLLSRRETKIVSYYITEFKFHVWNVKRQAWTHMTEDGLNTILYDDDLPNMRKNYFNMIKAPLEFLGVKFRQNRLTSDDGPNK